MFAVVILYVPSYLNDEILSGWIINIWKYANN